MSERIEQIKELLSESPEDSFLQYALSLEYDKSGDLKKAISVLENLLKQNEEYLGAYYKLGELYEKIENEDQAVDTYKKGIKLAEKQNDLKTKNELEEALFLVE